MATSLQHLRADYSRAELVLPQQYQWVASPQSGVERMMLDREGGESARATTIVRYAPGSRFPRHQHPLGEEILVLEGTFSDDDGHFTAGWYLRNPPGSSHQPSSAEGATIFVKLRQMQLGDGARVRIDTRDASHWKRQTGRELCALFSGPGEEVMLSRVEPQASVLSAPPSGGAELLVLSGELLLEGRCCPRGSWIRLPQGAAPEIVAGEGGVTVYLKTGHLAALAARSREDRAGSL